MGETRLSAEEIAAHSGITKDTVYDWIAEESMPAAQAGPVGSGPARTTNGCAAEGSATARATVRTTSPDHLSTPGPNCWRPTYPHQLATSRGVSREYHAG